MSLGMPVSLICHMSLVIKWVVSERGQIIIRFSPTSARDHFEALQLHCGNCWWQMRKAYISVPPLWLQHFLPSSPRRRTQSLPPQPALHHQPAPLPLIALAVAVSSSSSSSSSSQMRPPVQTVKNPANWRPHHPPWRKILKSPTMRHQCHA